MPSKILSEYCQVSSCAGVIDWHESKHLVGKFFWGLMVIFALTATVFQTYVQFESYWNKGRGQFKSNIERLSMGRDFKFPQVTICNFNRAMKSKLERDGVSSKVMEYAFGAIPMVYGLGMRTFRDMPFWSKNMQIYEKIWKNYSKEEPNVGQMIRKYGHDCDQTVLRLIFNGFEQPWDQICEKMQEVVTSYGRCWSYNTTMSQTRPGPSGGLQFTLNTNLKEYPTDMVMNNYMEEGMLILVGYNFEPYPSDPIIVQPGSFAHISMSATTQTYIRQPYPVFQMPCRTDTEIQYVNAEYTSSSCRLDCLANATMTNYGCVPLFDSKNNQRSCTPNETMNYVYPFFDGSEQYWQKEGQHKIDTFRECESACIDPCDSLTTITTTSTFASNHRPSYPNQEPIIRGALGESYSTNATLNLDDMTRVNIYFPILQYTNIEITEESPIFEFIADMGGQWGLFSGICILSIIQAIYYILYGLISYCYGTGKKTSVQPTTIAFIKSQDIYGKNSRFY